MTEFLFPQPELEGNNTLSRLMGWSGAPALCLVGHTVTKRFATEYEDLCSYWTSSDIQWQEKVCEPFGITWISA